jgi:DNA-binding SARP family transcriptional activator
MEQRCLAAAEHAWFTTLQTAARHWEAGEHQVSYRLQAQALEYAQHSTSSWALLWSCVQLSVCHAIGRNANQACRTLSRAIEVATMLNQPVVAGVCATIEALCANAPRHQPLPEQAQHSLCTLHQGLIEYLALNQLPLSDVCWPVHAPRAPARPTQRRHASPQMGGMRSDLQVTFLGCFRLAVADQPLSKLPVGQSGAFFRYLLVHHDQPVRGDVLQELFWPGVDPFVSRNRLHQTIHCLRRALAEAGGAAASLMIVCHEGCYGLALDRPIWVDSEAFEQLIAAGKQAERLQRTAQAMHTYREALALYQGDFLPEDCYDDWTGHIRARLHEARLSALDRLGRLALAQGDLLSASEYCRQLLALDTCREDAHQRLMHCYALLGLRTQALRQYEHCVTALREDLGLAPLPETTRLYQQIKDAASNSRSNTKIAVSR